MASISDEEADDFLNSIYASGPYNKAIRNLFRKEETVFNDLISKDILNKQNGKEVCIQFRDYVNPSIETKMKEQGCTGKK